MWSILIWCMRRSRFFFLLSAIALDIDIQKRLLGRYIYCSSISRMSGDILINDVTSGTNSTTLSGHIWLLGFERIKLEMYFGCKKKRGGSGSFDDIEIAFKCD